MAIEAYLLACGVISKVVASPVPQLLRLRSNKALRHYVVQYASKAWQPEQVLIEKNVFTLRQQTSITDLKCCGHRLAL